MTMDRLIGIPYEVAGGCYGLVRHALRERAGIELPELQVGRSVDERAARIAVGLPGWTRVVRPLPNDIAVLRVAGKASHVGLCLGSGRFLHVCDGGRSRIDRFGPTWAVEGFYRHV